MTIDNSRQGERLLVSSLSLIGSWLTNYRNDQQLCVNKDFSSTLAIMFTNQIQKPTEASASIPVEYSWIFGKHLTL